MPAAPSTAPTAARGCSPRFPPARPHAGPAELAVGCRMSGAVARDMAVLRKKMRAGLAGPASAPSRGAQSRFGTFGRPLR